jgi:hypothetical protein
MSPAGGDIVRWPLLSVALLLPAVAHPESRTRVASVDVEHIFGFTGPVLESDDGRAVVPIPMGSTSPRATSALCWWIV